MSLSLTLGSASSIDLLDLSDLRSNLSTMLRACDEFKPYLGDKSPAVPNNPAAGFALACLCGTAPTTVSGPVGSPSPGTSLGSRSLTGVSTMALATLWLKRTGGSQFFEPSVF
jgi:hypothetical protein